MAGGGACAQQLGHAPPDRAHVPRRAHRVSRSPCPASAAEPRRHRRSSSHRPSRRRSSRRRRASAATPTVDADDGSRRAGCGRSRSRAGRGRDAAAVGPTPPIRPGATSSCCARRPRRRPSSRRPRRRDGVKADRTFPAPSRASPRSSTRSSRRDLRADPNVVAVVPDEVVAADAQTVPTGVAARRRPRIATSAAIDGVDERVDADVAIVDTGITLPPRPQRRRRLQLLDRRTARPGATGTATARTSRARSARSTTASASSASPPAPGVWARQDPQRRRLRPDLVVRLRPRLDPRPARPDRPQPAAVRGGQHERHQVGLGRRQLRRSRNNGPAPPGDLPRGRRRASRSSPRPPTTRTTPASNIPASYNEVITVSALADTDGKPGGLGGNRCYSWGGYDNDDTFANFSNYGGDVDLIAPGQVHLVDDARAALRLHVRHVDGRAARRRRGRAVQGEPARTPRRPRSARRSRYLGNLDWKTSHRPRPVPRAAARRVAHRRARDVRLRAGRRPRGTRRGRHDRRGPGQDRPQRDASSSGSRSRSRRCRPAGRGPLGRPSLHGLERATRATSRSSSRSDTPIGRYEIGVRATNQGRTADTRSCRSTSSRTSRPHRRRSSRSPRAGRWAVADSRVDVTWPAGHRPVERDRRLRAADQRRRRRVRTRRVARSAAERSAATSLRYDTPTGSGSGRRTRPATGARGSQAATDPAPPGRRSQRVDRPPRRLDAGASASSAWTGR